MSLLMPEYERQLRAAAARLAGDGTTARPARGALRSWLVIGLTGAIAVAVAAIVLIGHHGATLDTTPGSALPAVQYDCAPHQIVPPKGRLVASAHGTVGGQPWTLETDSGRRGLGSVQAGQFLLGGHAYGFCEGALDVELVNAGPHGIVYGLATRVYEPPMVVEATTARGTAAHPVTAYKYPTTARQVPGATLFVGVLPAAACAYHDLALAAPKRPTSKLAEGTVSFFGPFSRACAPGQLRQTSKQGSGPSEPAVAAPPGLSAHARAEFNTGRAEVGRTGCLACHQIGSQGNDGPGPNLTHIGRSLPPGALSSALVKSPAPMPSFSHLPPRSLRAIVDFLKELR